MDILLWIILGAAAGWIADMFMASSHGVLEDIILGIIGGFVGGLVMNLFGQPGVTGFNFYSLIVAVIGAAILIYLGRVIHR
ncbi:MAG TPA: GlsB/YeaQ/YmgE family stress response membrane protein [Candidatus Eisenbacteria bacterium]|nr:GlsB/YeaQ/YmgE family stress response membrane protein [Candidatus Eisenbacteria bacterium]